MINNNIRSELSHLSSISNTQIPNIMSPREMQILLLIAKGLTSIEISKKLCLSSETVRTYRKSLLSKFGAKNSAHLVFKAWSEGLVNS